MQTVQEVVAGNVAELRARRRLTVRELSGMLAELGQPILPSGITKIEAGDRKVSVTELFALAVALDVSPVRLMLPPERSDDEVQITPERSVPWPAAWRWAVGEQPLLGRDETLSLDDRSVREFIAENRPFEHSVSDEAARHIRARVGGDFEATFTGDRANVKRSIDPEDFWRYGER